jgi:radical SAM protein with 4Fe4S-binding SPASM domain
MEQQRTNNMKKFLKEHDLNPDTFCLAPYITTDLDQMGHIRSCYRGRNNLGNWKHENFEEVFNNDEYKQLRQSLNSGEKNSNCKSCWMAESHNAISPRVDIFYDAVEHIKDIDNFVETIKQDITVGNTDNLSRIELRPSLLCNMRCMHCGPDSSTRWIEKLKNKEDFETYDSIVGRINDDDNAENKITNKNINEHFKNGLTSNSTYKEEIKKLLSKTTEIQFAGGEPLLTPEHEEWLNYLVNEAKTSKNQYLSYNSNFNVKNIEKYFPYWKEFKKVIIRASIDTSFDSYEYFRAEGDVELLKSNIKKFNAFFKNNDSVLLSGTVTFNMFSALTWKDILEDWINNDLRFHASLVLNHPISAIGLPNDLKEKAIEDIYFTIENIRSYTDNALFIDHFIHHATNCMEYLKNSKRDDMKLTTNTCKYIQMCDRMNDKRIFDYFPELRKYWHDLE